MNETLCQSLTDAAYWLGFATAVCSIIVGYVLRLVLDR